MDTATFLRIFEDKSGYDFRDYSQNSISRRLEKICRETGLSFEQILDRVAADKEFVRRIVEDITVNTTELFRDPQVWVALGQNLYRHLPKQTMSTIWHIGCSMGLEVYSNIILLTELGMADRVRVIGTDINPTVLDTARRGVYSLSFNRVYIDNFNAVMQGLGLDAAFDKYFEIDEAQDTISVRPELLRKPIFLQQDLVKDRAPFAYRVDVAFFRNVMIYFNDALQTRIMRDVLAKMHPGAMLVMGKQEDLPQGVAREFVRTGAFYKRTNAL